VLNKPYLENLWLAFYFHPSYLFAEVMLGKSSMLPRVSPPKYVYYGQARKMLVTASLEFEKSRLPWEGKENFFPSGALNHLKIRMLNKDKSFFYNG
jgi:hypothetical protein